jgi:trehalose-phosphatase
MESRDWVGRVAAEYARGRPLALFFDYDGTLTPIVEYPNLAVLSDGTRDQLAGLAALDRVVVAVLSGRALAHLKELVGLPGVLYAASSGIHLDLGDAELVDDTLAAFEPVADALTVSLSEPIRWFPGAWVERKPGCLSVHYRGLTPLKAVCLKDVVRDTIEFLGDAAPPLRIRDVSRALEITLASAWTKGDALERLLADRDPDTLAVYAGDGANDEEAVDRVNARGGVTVGVGPEAPRAVHVRLPTQAAFAADLDSLCDHLAWSAAPSSPR